MSALPLLKLHVLGTPRPQGNHTPFVAANGKARLREKRGTCAEWRNAVADKANAAVRDWPDFPYTGAVRVDLVLELPKPAKPKDPCYPSSRNTGDVEKHLRAINDALTAAGVIKDDCQVVSTRVDKRYASFAPGAHITVWPMNTDTPSEVQ